MARQIQYQAIAEPLLAPVTLDAPSLSWHPEHTNLRPPTRPALVVAAMMFCAYAVGAVLPDVAPPALAWSPTYADFAARPTPRVTTANHQAIGLTLALADLPIPELSWKPEYPSFIWSSARLLTANQVACVQPPPVLFFPIPTLSWEPKYPDFPGRTRRALGSPQQQSYAFHSFQQHFVAVDPMTVFPAGSRPLLFSAGDRVYIIPAAARLYVFMAKDRPRLPEED